MEQENLSRRSENREGKKIKDQGAGQAPRELPKKPTGGAESDEWEEVRSNLNSTSGYEIKGKGKRGRRSEQKTRREATTGWSSKGKRRGERKITERSL